MVKKEVIETLKDFIKLLRSEGIVIDKAFLYGSHLTGTPTNESDIDLMLVADNDDDYLTGRIWSLTKRVNSRIEPYLIAKDRFYSANTSPLIEMIKSTGLEIA